MALKRLTLQDVDQMKSMVQRGVAPEDIAKHFKIAISSVHNYKKQFKQQGVKFPDVRGKRPTGSVGEVSKPITMLRQVDQQAQQQQQSSAAAESSMNFVVNGVQVQVSAGAKNVNISKGNIEVNF